MKWKYTSDSLHCPNCPHLMCGMEIVDNNGTLQPICLDCCKEAIRLSIRNQMAILKTYDNNKKINGAK